MEQAPKPGRAIVDALSPAALAAVLEQSIDCVKLIGLDGTLQYINHSGLRMMEVESFADVAGRSWASLWPDVTNQAIAAAYTSAADGCSTRFRALCPSRAGVPRWWDVTISAVTDASGMHSGYLCVTRDVTDAQNAREALEIASTEVKHRLKNTYTMIGSLLTAFARGDAGNEGFARTMTDRLGALATAQSLFLSNEADCEIARLIPALLTPFDSPNCPVVIGHQAAAVVDQGVADAIALVLGELSVNSAKHGAFGHGGEVEVGSSLSGALLTITWAEQSLRAVTHHSRRGGQGIRLMQRIAHTRGGSIAIDWRTDGLEVTLAFPDQAGAHPVSTAA
ncbi:PAS domain-containing protein [Sphingomonas sp. KR1UV-12]|uniref:histidine kinase n=1 Tax=Sphingomonas aurea TaxID=3063994 RepID=A0ABT9ENC8_9SPHN|nr:PAS domain-containing protein [Sphingomonas sp. KR1UV-12]MDP1028342.1 PAS domain-containing protein [Sphingomonas sp. KR1UV-12]